MLTFLMWCAGIWITSRVILNLMRFFDWATRPLDNPKD